MPRLSEIQAEFARHVLSGGGQMPEHVLDDRGIDAELRLAVYANAYRARLVETLAKDFAALRHHLGEEEFETLAHDYIEAHPSRYFSLRWFGEALPAFTAGHRTGRSTPALAELARLEWAFIDAFDAEDAACADEAGAAAVAPAAWPTLRIALHPSVQLVCHEWDIVALWRAYRDERAAPEPRRLDAPGCCLVWRQGLDTRYRALAPDEARGLQALARGGDFSTLCEEVAACLPETEGDPQQAALRAATLLKTWLHAGLICELRPPGEASPDRET
ncbi:MAG TPA: DNA-binding domain-containing protein [Gammaproteobacteria bacterium]|nr:DNA-binding domain-containing protein [Gammaproteobacteria bacterium]